MIDLVGDLTFGRTLMALKPGGTLVSVGNLAGGKAFLRIADLGFGQRQICSIRVSEVDLLKPWLERVRNGEIHPVVDTVLPVSEAAIAHQLVADNRHQGSVVLLPWCY
ncbi:zinc-binding dehydrogenase [Pseudomonas sp. EL_65y_Pfl2_R95]|uniref:zinc-binding dehydrogenase n=1 Tax=Pseudomonas sp. EL_65y_Pfl2_R95 TaxID=3088698 RepID=UPI0030D7BC91